MCQQLNVFSFICVLFGAGFLFLVSIWYHVVFVVPSLGRLCIERKCKALQIRWPLRGRRGWPARRHCPRRARDQPAPPRGGETLCFCGDATWGQLGIVTEIRYFLR